MTGLGGLNVTNCHVVFLHPATPRVRVHVGSRQYCRQDLVRAPPSRAPRGCVCPWVAGSAAKISPMGRQDLMRAPPSHAPPQHVGIAGLLTLLWWRAPAPTQSFAQNVKLKFKESVSKIARLDHVNVSSVIATCLESEPPGVSPTQRSMCSGSGAVCTRRAVGGEGDVGSTRVGQSRRSCVACARVPHMGCVSRMVGPAG